MRPRKVKEAYECPSCGEWHEGEPELVTAWKVDDLDEDTYLTTTEPEEVQAYTVECDGTPVEQDELTLLEAFMCGECETIYGDRDEAKECCR